MPRVRQAQTEARKAMTPEARASLAAWLWNYRAKVKKHKQSAEETAWTQATCALLGGKGPLCSAIKRANGSTKAGQRVIAEAIHNFYLLCVAHRDAQVAAKATNAYKEKYGS